MLKQDAPVKTALVHDKVTDKKTARYLDKDAEEEMEALPWDDTPLIRPGSAEPELDTLSVMLLLILDTLLAPDSRLCGGGM